MVGSAPVRSGEVWARSLVVMTDMGCHGSAELCSRRGLSVVRRAARAGRGSVGRPSARVGRPAGCVSASGIHVLFLLASRDSRRGAKGGIQWERSHGGDGGGRGQDAGASKVRTGPIRRKVSQGPYETSPVDASFLPTSGSGSIRRRVRSGAPSCEDSLMRHPPHSVLLVSDALSTPLCPVFSGRGATAACAVDRDSEATPSADRRPVHERRIAPHSLCATPATRRPDPYGSCFGVGAFRHRRAAPHLTRRPPAPPRP